MEKSASIAKLAQALMEAQSEIPMLKTNAYNSFNDTHYVDMGLIIETVRPVLKRHGLVILQPATSDESRVGVETILMHESGEYLSVTACMEISKETGKSLQQTAGAAISYLRRYSLISTLELYTKDEKGSGNGGQRMTKPQAQGKPPSGSPQIPAEKRGNLGGEKNEEVKFRFSDAPIVNECARVWKCKPGEASVTLYAEQGNIPERLTVREASAWAVAWLKKQGKG